MLVTALCSPQEYPPQGGGAAHAIVDNRDSVVIHAVSQRIAKKES